MFILIFVVFFGSKKSTTPVYTAVMLADSLYQTYFFDNKTQSSVLKKNLYCLVLQQMTYVTSRTTTIILLLF